MISISNQERQCLGLDPLESGWDAVALGGEDSTVYFAGDVIKRWVVSSGADYSEYHLEEPTRHRTHLLPRTTRGKAQKLTAATLSRRTPVGVYLQLSDARLVIGNCTTQRTFYSSVLAGHSFENTGVFQKWVSGLCRCAPAGYVEDLRAFKEATRTNVKLREGDFFAARLGLDRQYAVGRILMHVPTRKRQGLIPEPHALNNLMARPVVVKLYRDIFPDPAALDLDTLRQRPALPAQYIMDNELFYGSYPIIGHRTLTVDDLAFPMSYGQCLASDQVCFQWGMFYREKSLSEYDAHLGERRNPYRNLSLGLGLNVTRPALEECVEAASNAPYWSSEPQGVKKNDLRNPRNAGVASEVLRAFGLDPERGYEQVCDQHTFLG